LSSAPRLAFGCDTPVAEKKLLLDFSGTPSYGPEAADSTKVQTRGK
jgi:hypothetical protein